MKPYRCKKCGNTKPMINVCKRRFCGLCAAKYKSEWWLRNREKYKSEKSYYERNREAQLIKMKEWYRANREKVLEYQKSHAQKNFKRLQAYRRDYYLKNKATWRRRKDMTEVQKIRADDRVSKWVKNNPERRKEIANRYRYKRYWGPELAKTVEKLNELRRKIKDV